MIEPCANSATQPNEHWLRPAAPLVSGTPGECAAVSGAAAVLAGCANTTAQHWQAQPDGTVRAAGKCLASGTTAGSAVSVAACSGAASTKWQLVSKNPVAVQVAKRRPVRHGPVLGHAPDHGTLRQQRHRHLAAPLARSARNPKIPGYGRFAMQPNRPYYRLPGTAGVPLSAGRREIFEPSQTSGSYFRPTTRSFIGMSALSVILMCSGQTSVQHLVMLQ